MCVQETERPPAALLSHNSSTVSWTKKMRVVVWSHLFHIFIPCKKNPDELRLDNRSSGATSCSLCEWVGSICAPMEIDHAPHPWSFASMNSSNQAESIIEHGYPWRRYTLFKSSASPSKEFWTTVPKNIALWKCPASVDRIQTSFHLTTVPPYSTWSALVRQSITLSSKHGLWSIPRSLTRLARALCRCPARSKGQSRFFVYLYWNHNNNITINRHFSLSV
jgi:hypothetical protein